MTVFLRVGGTEYNTHSDGKSVVQTLHGAVTSRQYKQFIKLENSSSSLYLGREQRCKDLRPVKCHL